MRQVPDSLISKYPSKIQWTSDTTVHLAYIRAIEPVRPSTGEMLRHLIHTFLYSNHKNKGGTGGSLLDFMFLNKFMRYSKFKKEMSITKTLQQRDFVMSVGLMNAFQHVLIPSFKRHFLRFSYVDWLWQLRAMPFSLASVPCIFTKLMVTLAVSLCVQGIHTHRYLDDLLAGSCSRTYNTSILTNFLWI